MGDRQKRQRVDGSSTSRQTIAQMHGDETPPPPEIVSRAPWPKREGTKIPSRRVWNDSPRIEIEKEECVYRDISEDWDDYDTLFYNAWLGVEIKPTRMIDAPTLRAMGICDEVCAMIEKIGLGTICIKKYDLYPELVRQFMATARVYYRNEVVKNAQEGTLTFMIRGVRYRLSFRDICRIFRFRQYTTGVALPGQFNDAQNYWSKFGVGRYDSKTSTQTDVRHPVLRYVIRLIGNTILCKMEPGKMRMSELMLLCYALEDLCAADCEWDELDHSLNMGAIFAHHLVSLKTKPFHGKGPKSESIGSLLTPIFHHCRISTDGCKVVTARLTMDEEYLKNARWLKPDLLWCFHDEVGPHMVKLPNPLLTAITDDSAQLAFRPPPTLLRSAAPSRRRRGASSTAPSSAAEDAPLPDLAGGQSSSHTSPQLPATPPIPMETETFQRYVADSFQSIWNAISTLSRCGCVRSSRRHEAIPPQPIPTPARSPSPVAESDED